MGILIENILTVLPDNAAPKVCNIYIEGAKIAAIDNKPEGFTADKILSGSGKLLIPGLVNAHTHAYMTIFRNCADDLKFNDWLFNRIMPMEERLTGSACYYGTLLSCIEMIRTGTTTFLDMHMFPHMTPKAVSESGMRAVISRGLSGGVKDAQGAVRRVNEAFSEMHLWRGMDKIRFMLGPHAPYSCDEQYQREIADLAQQMRGGIHIHVAESQNEMETIRREYGCTPVELLDRTGLLLEKTAAVHCVHLTEEDIALFAARKASVVTCPVSNLKLGNGIAPILKLQQAGVNIALGTDGAASNNSLNMFRELAFLTLLPKGVSGDAAAVSAYEGFQMATKNGAKALGLGGITGEIKPGLEADLVILDLDRPNLHPLNDPVAALAYSANGSEVETVIIGGKIVMENCEFPSLDVKEIYFEADKISNSIKTR